MAAESHEKIGTRPADNMNFLCVGLNDVDLITTVERFPEEDSDQRGLGFRKQRGGNPSNMCTVLRQLNMPCEYLGVLPPPGDPEHRWLKEDFESRGIKIKGCVFSDTPCPMATVLLSRQSASRTIVYCDNGHPELSYQQFISGVGDRLLTFSSIHFELRPNVEECVHMLETVTEKCKDHRAQHGEGPCSSALPIISVEVEKPELLHPERAMMLADITFISKDWARSQGWPDMRSAATNASKLCKPGSIIVCAWAEEGAAAWHNNTVFTASATAPDRVVDTLGAGDTFVAGFLYAYVRHMKVQDALEFACGLAAFKCTKDGYDSLHEFARSKDSDGSIVSQSLLKML